MNNQKLPLAATLTVLILIVVGLGLLPRATASSVPVQPTPVQHTERDAVSDVVPDTTRDALDVGDPVSIEIDKEGYTVWTYDYSDDAWCVMYSRLRWPFDLGTQDPSELSETVLKLTFAEMVYAIGSDGKPRYTDPTWSVALNGKPPDDWNIIRYIAAVPTWGYKIPVTQEIPFSYKELIDGENNLWLQQHDYCPTESLPDAACTCIELTSVQLQAMVKLGIRSVSPAPDALNVRADQRENSEIRVAFTTFVDPDSVSEETFQVFYYDQDLNRVPVDGQVLKLSKTSLPLCPAGRSKTASVTRCRSGTNRKPWTTVAINGSKTSPAAR